MEPNDDKRKRGAIARAANLPGERKSEIAKDAADARWSKSVSNVLASAKLVLGGVEIDCYVTDDGERLISGRSMQEILRLVDEEVPQSGLKPGSRLTRLLSNKVLKPLIYKDKGLDHFSPKKRRLQGRMISGFNSEMLVDICEGMLEARRLGKLKTARQAIVAAQAELILRGLAKTGIVALIDEATGYQNMRPADGLRSYFDLILKKDLAAWFKRFPDEYYENIYKLRGWVWQGMSKNRYSVVSHYTNDIIYERMVPGITEEFDKRNPKNAKGNRKVNNQQLLNDDIGDKLFSQQMFTVLALQRACLGKPGNKWQAFMQLMNEVLPKKGTTILLPFPNPETNV